MPEASAEGEFDSKGGPVVLVTGGSGGLGRGVVRVLLEGGARVHVPVYSQEELPGFRRYLDETFGSSDSPEALEASGRLVLHPGVDLTDARAVRDLVRAMGDQEGRPPDAVVNLAGGFAMASIEATDPDDWTRLWQMNATTAFLVSRAVFPGMVERGSGRIVNVSALPAINRGRSNLSAYGAAKAAVLNLTHTLSKEGVDHGITVNAIVPSIIDTPGNRDGMPDADRSRWLDPIEVGRVIRFLLSDDARIVNGAAVPLTL